MDMHLQGVVLQSAPGKNGFIHRKREPIFVTPKVPVLKAMFVTPNVPVLKGIVSGMAT